MCLKPIVIFAIISASAISQEIKKINSISQCSEPFEGNSLEINLKSDPARADVKLKLNMDITTETLVRFNIDKKMSENNWSKDVTVTTNTIEEALRNYAGNAWDKIRDKASPKIEGYNIPAGEYEWTDLELLSSDCTLPGGVEGEIASEFRPLTDDEEAIVCIRAEATIIS